MTRRDDFIQNVLEFDAIMQFPPHVRHIIQVEYFSQPDFTVEKLHYASKACGTYPYSTRVVRPKCAHRTQL